MAKRGILAVVQGAPFAVSGAGMALSRVAGQRRQVIRWPVRLQKWLAQVVIFQWYQLCV